MAGDGFDPSAQVAMLAGVNAAANGGQMTAMRLFGVVGEIDGKFNPANLGMVGTQRIFNAQIVPGAGAFAPFLQGNPGPITKILMEVFGKGHNTSIADAAANHLGGTQEAMIEGVQLAPMDYGGDFSASRGNVAPIGPGSSGGNLEIG